MRKATLSLILSFCASHLSAQVTFQKTFGGVTGDWGATAIPLSDGNYIIGGYGNNFGAGNYDAYLIKTNASGDTLWTKTYGGAQNDFANKVRRTADGGYILVGTTASITSGGTDIYLLKTDSSGTLQWSRSYGDIEDEEGTDVRQTLDGGYIISGNTLSFSAGVTYDAYLIRTNSTGDTLWTKVFSQFGDEWGNAVLEDTDGSILLAGVTSSVGAGAYDIFIIKTNAIGNFVWSRTYGGFALEYTYTIEHTADGEYMVGGFTSTYGSGDVDVMLMKVGLNGNVIWSKVYGGTDSDVAYAFVLTGDGGYIVTGNTRSFGAGDSDYYLLKTDSAGNLSWSKTYGGTMLDESYSVNQTADGGYIVNGFSYNFGQGASDIYVLKTDTIGSSGCNESNPATATGNATFTAVGFSYNIFYGCNVLAPSPVTGAGNIPQNICIPTTMEETAAENSFSIYPNPAERELIVECPERIQHAEIYNATGRRVSPIAKPVFGTRAAIDVSSLSPGIYFLQLTTGQKVYSQKFMRQ